MKKINSTVVATPSTVKNTTEIPFVEIWDLAEKSTAYYARRGGRYLRPEDLQDMTSEVATRVCEKWSSYDPSKSKLSTWVGIFAHNYQVDLFKKESRKTRLEDTYIAGGYKTDSRAESYFAGKCIGEAMASLPERQAKVLSLTGDELKPRHIAVITDTTPNAVSVQLHKARKKASEILGEEFLEEYGVAA